MKILLHHNLPKRLCGLLASHQPKTTRQMGWEKLGNGILLKTAADAEFGAFLSIDKKLEHEQNLSKLPLPVIVIDGVSNALPDLMAFVPFILELLKIPLDRVVYVIREDGRVDKIPC